MNEKLTLQELIDLLAARHQMEPGDADAFVRAFWALIEEGLKSDNYVKIKGLGTFKLIDTEARESINIQTGERIEIQSHVRITFTPEASLRDQINRPFSHFETVVLNESTNFDDLNSSDGAEESDEDVAQVEDGEPVESVESDDVAADVQDAGKVVAEETVANEDDSATIEAESEADQALREEIKTEDTESEKVEPESEKAESESDNDESEEAEVKETESEAKESEQIESVPVVANDTTDGEINLEEVEFQEVVDESQNDIQVKENEGVETPLPVEETGSDLPVADSEEPKSEKVEEPVDNEAKTDSVHERLRKSKRRLLWCLIICALLVGIVIGGFTSLAILSRNSDVTDTKVCQPMQVESQMDEEVLQESTAMLENSEQIVPAVTDSVVVDSLKQSEVVEESKAVQVKPVQTLSTPVRQKVFFSEDINYKIVGTLGSHKLRNGETLTRIALKYYGNKKMWPYLVKHNVKAIKNPDNVPIGTIIKIPKLEPETAQKP